MGGVVGTGRTCLHCALVRALEAEASSLEARGVTVTVSRSEAVWLPIPGARIYRDIRRIVRQAAALAQGHRIRLAVVDLDGRPQVEVTAAALLPGRALVFGAAFPRVLTEPLARGFAEGIAPTA